jgi:CheY-like chemotaxis protein
VSNAVKFTPEGGRVDVQLERRGPRARLVVQDTGRGIAREFLPHLFERFSQAEGGTTRAHGGLGLGLAIVRHLVELHRGTVAAESPGEGQGATFTVELPLAAAPAPDRIPVPRPSRREVGEVTLHGTRVLLVDDDPDTLEVLSTALRTHGAAVSPATSAPEALELLRRGEVDVLVSDIAMPGEDGYRLIERVRRDPRVATLPAIAVSAYARAEDREAALRAGYHGHIAKPVEPVQLAEEVARVLRR